MAPLSPDARRAGRARRGPAHWAAGLLAWGLATACAAGSPPDAATPPTQSAYNTPAVNAALALYAAGRLPQAERSFTTLARQGNALARYNLAMMHLRGEVAQPQSRPGTALAGSIGARAALCRQCSRSGAALEQGVAGPRDVPRAQDWYQQAAELGHMDAQVALGTAYYLGRGRPHDAPQAAHWYREAAVQGDVGRAIPAGLDVRARRGPAPGPAPGALLVRPGRAPGATRPPPARCSELDARLSPQ